MLSKMLTTNLYNLDRYLDSGGLSDGTWHPGKAASLAKTLVV